MEFLPWIIIIWAAERKTLQRASICQEPICIFPSCEVLLSLSGWPSDSFHINPHLHDDEWFPHCQERAYDFIQPLFPHPDQPETELRNPTPWHMRVAAPHLLLLLLPIPGYVINMEKAKSKYPHPGPTQYFWKYW